MHFPLFLYFCQSQKYKMQDSPYIDVHTHCSGKPDGVISVINYFPEQFYKEDFSGNFISIGLHPWHVDKDNIVENIEQVKSAASLDFVLAIGEIGLDRSIPIPLDVQNEAFSQQIKIANRVKKPIIVHCVKCFPELLSLKKKLRANTPWLIHGFRNNRQIAQDLLKQNCFISFGEALLFDNKLQEIFKAIPLDQIFLETDESNHSIIEIYKKAAALKNLQIVDLKNTIFKNYTAVFKPK